MKRIEDLHVLIDRIPYAEGNIGEEAILASLIQDLEACGIRRIAVLSNVHERTQKRHGSKITVISDNPGRWLTMPYNIAKYDLLIWGGGHMLQDRSSQIYIPYVTKTLLLARLLGIPRFIYAPGLGPVVNRLGKFLSKLAIGGSEIIIVRDDGSVDLLKQIGVKDRVYRTADPAFSLHISETGRHPSGSSPPTIGVAPRRLFYRKGSVLPVCVQIAAVRQSNLLYESYIEEMAAALDQLVEKFNATIVLIPMDIGANPRDDLVCRQIRRQMKKNANVKLYDDDPTLELFIHRLSELDLLVSARLHGIILGLRVGLPFIGIDSDGKISRLARKIQADEYVIKDVDFNRDCFYDMVCRILDGGKKLAHRLLEQTSKIGEEAQNNRYLLKSYLNTVCNQNQCSVQNLRGK